MLPDCELSLGVEGLSVLVLLSGLGVFSAAEPLSDSDVPPVTVVLLGLELSVGFVSVMFLQDNNTPPS